MPEDKENKTTETNESGATTDTKKENTGEENNKEAKSAKTTTNVDTLPDPKISDSDVASLVKEGVSEDAIRNAIKKGARISKEQLYPEIERLKGKLSELQSQINTAKNAEDKSKIDSDKLAKLEADKARLEAEKLGVEDKLSVVEDALVDTTNKVNELTHRLDSTALEDYRKEKIAELEKEGTKVIKRLVVGKTKEEIDASIEIAKSEYEIVQNNLKKEFNLPEKTDKTEKEKEEPKPITVTRIGTDPASLQSWKKDKATILKETYAQARKAMNMPE